MNNLSISEGSEAESSDLNPPQKITKTEDDPENPWINITGKLPAQLAQKRKVVHNIVDDIEQILYPPEFFKEDHSSKNIVGKVFLRNWHHKEQFQIENLGKEFTKEDLFIADNLWKAFSLNTRVELKQSIISALRQMRDQRTLISQANQQTRQYAKNLVDSAGIISHAEITGELRTPKYRRLRFTVTFVVHTDYDGKPSDFEEISMNIRANPAYSGRRKKGYDSHPKKL